MTIQCQECSHVERDWLADHLAEAHDLSVDDYLSKHPSATTASQRLLDRWEEDRPNRRRTAPPNPKDLTIEFSEVNFPVHNMVPESACLPMPSEYRIPRHGVLGQDIQHAVVALKRKRTLYIHGLPGSGKDAMFHAWSAMTRTPGLIFQVQPGVDIQGWFFQRSFDEKGTYDEPGELFKALVNGYKCADGTVVPYIIVISDMDRMDRAQAEYMRLITDSIQGRVKGPGGTTHRVLEGTIICATANTAGGGDSRGRMTSANVIDASILDRFDRTFMFSWMDWRDEGPIVRAKFPLLVEHRPSAFATMGKATKILRKAIAEETLYAEFSHRGLCKVLGHAEDLIYIAIENGNVLPSKLMSKACRAWWDGLPDEETIQTAKNLLDAFIDGGAIDEGDTSHITTGQESLAPNF